jgi:hypothetical protein
MRAPVFAGRCTDAAVYPRKCRPRLSVTDSDAGRYAICRRPVSDNRSHAMIYHVGKLHLARASRGRRWLLSACKHIQGLQAKKYNTFGCVSYIMYCTGAGDSGVQCIHTAVQQHLVQRMYSAVAECVSVSSPAKY